MEQPLEYCALRYLLVWEQKERSLHAGMKASPSTEDLHKSLRHFRISRNFKGVEKKQNANRILHAVSRVTHNKDSSAPKNVVALAAMFAKDFGQTNLSAASKLLWLTYRRPYVIYDARTVSALHKLGCKFNKRDYIEYFAVWQEKYNEHRSSVKEAAQRLANLQPFFASWHTTSISLSALARRPWFLERVFDLYLWELGGDI